jgi:hypothetical protein
MTKNEIHTSLLEISPEEAEGLLIVFLLPPTNNNPIAFINTKANFSTNEGEYIKYYHV